MMDKSQQVVLPDLYDDGDIFLSSKDNQNFKKIFQAIANGQANIAIISNKTSLIDHYGQILISRLRKLENLRIEVYFPSNTETLINRFNQILANITVAEARGEADTSEPDRILVVHDFSAMNDRELQLMARITNDFPGAKTRMVLLLDLSVPNSNEKGLESFGKKLSKWKLVLPSDREVKELFRLAKTLGFDEQATALVKKIGFEFGQGSTHVQSKQQPEEKVQSLENIPAQDSVVGSNLTDENYAPRLMPIMLAVLFISILVIGFLYKDNILGLISGDFRRHDNVSSASPNKELIDIERSAQTTIKEQSVSIDSLEEAKSPIEDNHFINEQEVRVLPEQGEDIENGGSMLSEPTGQLVNKGVILEGFKDGDWLLQHVAVTTYGDAKDWRDQYGALSNALIVPIISGDPDTRRYVVVTGPYSSKKEALNFLKVPGVPADYYPRTVRSLRAVIPASLLE